MNVSKQTTFYYHADANALGGVLKQPLERVISTHASVSLAQAGGFSTSRVDRFHMDGLVSFEAAHVTVSGSEHKEHGNWRTVATAVVERLNVLEVVTADRIVAQVSVMHPYGDGPSQISLNGTQFVNLRINGAPVRHKLDSRMFGARPHREEEREHADDQPVANPPRFGDLLRVAEEQHRETAALRKRLVDRLGRRFAWSDPATNLDQKGAFLCTLVQGVEAEAPGEGYGHVLHLPDFGNIFLGELLVTRFSAQLTMLRVEMGCLADGTISVGTAYSNGSPMP